MRCVNVSQIVKSIGASSLSRDDACDCSSQNRPQILYVSHDLLPSTRSTITMDFLSGPALDRGFVVSDEVGPVFRSLFPSTRADTTPNFLENLERMVWEGATI